MMSSSSRLSAVGTIVQAPTASSGDVDFGYAPMQNSYVGGGFEPNAGMVMSSSAGDRAPPLLLHQHGGLYDCGLDSFAAAFPFVQEPPALFPGSSGSLQHQHQHQHQNFGGAPLQQGTIPMALSSSSSVQAPMMMMMPGVPSAAPDVYPFGGGGGGGGFVKREDGPFLDVGGGGGGGRIGLNLGRRTYFSPADVLAVDRLLMRSRLGGAGAMGMLGLGLGAVHHHHHNHQPPRCQAEGCKADLSAAKHYHRRHKVCEYHAKAASVASAGKQQRFCQQCSRFHVLGEFDEAKRSCRKRLTEHNRRRRKPAGGAQANRGSSSSPPPPKKADTGITSSYTSDHKAANGAGSRTAAAAVLSPRFGCSRLIQQQREQEIDCSDVVGQASSCSNNNKNAATALSLLAATGSPPRDCRVDGGAGGGGLDTMLMQPRRRANDHDHDQEHQQQQHLMMMTSTAHRRGDNNNILSCSSASTTDQQQNSASCCNGSGGGGGDGMQHFFEVDFM